MNSSTISSTICGRTTHTQIAHRTVVARVLVRPTARLQRSTGTSTVCWSVVACVPVGPNKPPQRSLSKSEYLGHPQNVRWALQKAASQLAEWKSPRSVQTSTKNFAPVRPTSPSQRSPLNLKEIGTSMARPLVCRCMRSCGVNLATSVSTWTFCSMMSFVMLSWRMKMDHAENL